MRKRNAISNHIVLSLSFFFFKRLPITFFKLKKKKKSALVELKRVYNVEHTKAQILRNKLSHGQTEQTSRDGPSSNTVSLCDGLSLLVGATH